MRYWRVYWHDADGEHYSPPMPSWTAAELYRRAIGGNAEVLAY